MLTTLCLAYVTVSGFMAGSKYKELTDGSKYTPLDKPTAFVEACNYGAQLGGAPAKVVGSVIDLVKKVHKGTKK